MQNFLTIKRAAEMLSVDEKTVRRMLPRLEAVNMATPGARKRLIRIPVDALERFLQGCVIPEAIAIHMAKAEPIYFERRKA